MQILNRNYEIFDAIHSKIFWCIVSSMISINQLNLIDTMSLKYSNLGGQFMNHEHSQILEIFQVKSPKSVRNPE